MEKYFRTYITIIALAACSLFMAPAALADKATVEIGHTKAPVFTTREKIVFTLKTDYGSLWKHRAPPKHGSARGRQGIRRLWPGLLSWTDSKGKHDLPVQVHLRGNTSQVESQCPFPKMTLELKRFGTGTGFQRGRYSLA